MKNRDKELIEQTLNIKEKKKAVIFAHNYQVGRGSGYS